MKLMDLRKLGVIGFLRSWIVNFAAKCLRNDHLRCWCSWEMILSGMTLLIEAISASLEQTSPHKLKAAVYGLIIAAISLFLAFVHLASKDYNKHSKSTVSNEGRQKPGHDHLVWGFADAFGLVSYMLTLISACLHYYYLSNGKQQPIRL